LAVFKLLIISSTMPLTDPFSYLNCSIHWSNSDFLISSFPLSLKQGKPVFNDDLLKDDEEKTTPEGLPIPDRDEMFDKAARLVVSMGQGSVSNLQRRLSLGYARAARLMDSLEAEGIVGPPEGSKPRQVLVPPDYFEEVDHTHF
jgi:DNA segregation ATPase FtsK/SpoIIIE-like protein